MNYPWNYAGGAGVFWSGFGFQFDDQELIHIRHGFRAAVKMGGNPFATGAALRGAGELGRPGRGRVGAPARGRRRRAASATASPCRRPRAVRHDLAGPARDEPPPAAQRHRGDRHPAPVGPGLIYEPLLHQCVQEETSCSRATRPGHRGAFIHYGQGGFYFDSPGRYRVRARTTASDGSIVLSNDCASACGAATQDDEDAADLMLGDEQGTLLYLVGSDFEGLRAGNDALTELRERLSDHPLAAVARIVQGTNAAREFKQVERGQQRHVRKPHPRRPTS